MSSLKIERIPRAARHADLTTRALKLAEGPPKAEYADRVDSWANSTTGIGTSRDKQTSTQFVGDGCLTFNDLENLFHNDDVAGRICSKLPSLALGQGYTLDNPALQDKLTELGVCETFKNAWTFARAYGGAAVLCGMQGSPETPAGEGGVESLLVLDRFSLAVQEYYTAGPKFGKPKMYAIAMPVAVGLSGINGLPQSPLAKVHESRLITFPGGLTSPRKKYANQYWDDSVLQRCYAVIQAYGLTWASVTHLLQDIAQGIVSIEGLYDIVVSGDHAQILDRIKMMDEQRSVARSVLLDKDRESFERTSTPLSSIPELIDRLTERLAAAAEMPITVMMGSSPAGMNATGESDLENWYGEGRKARTDVITPRIGQLCKLVDPAAAAPVVGYPPFWMPTAKEVAEEEFIQAQRDQIYNVMGAWDAQEVRDTRLATDPRSKLGAGKKALTREELLAAAAAGTPGSKAGTRHFSAEYDR